MSSYDLAALQELLGKATPGPWRWSDGTDGGKLVAPGGEEVLGVCGYGGMWEDIGGEEADLALVAAAVNALPAMLADLKALTAARESGALKRAAFAFRGKGSAISFADAAALRELAVPPPPEEDAT